MLITILVSMVVFLFKMCYLSSVCIVVEIDVRLLSYNTLQCSYSIGSNTKWLDKNFILYEHCYIFKDCVFECWIIIFILSMSSDGTWLLIIYRQFRLHILMAACYKGIPFSCSLRLWLSPSLAKILAFFIFCRRVNFGVSALFLYVGHWIVFNVLCSRMWTSNGQTPMAHSNDYNIITDSVVIPLLKICLR